MLPTTFRQVAILLLIVVACIPGCGDGKIRRYPVKGTVLVDRQPAEGAIVIFVPISGEPQFMRERPFSRTDGQGKFELRTFRPGDGAPAGEYKVTVSWSGPPGSSSGADRLGGRYAIPEETELTATVAETANELEPLELTAK